MTSYWVLDPQEPSFLALELADGVYRTGAEVSGTHRARLTVPFAVEVVPAELVRPPGTP